MNPTAWCNGKITGFGATEKGISVLRNSDGKWQSQRTMFSKLVFSWAHRETTVLFPLQWDEAT